MESVDRQVGLDLVFISYFYIEIKSPFFEAVVSVPTFIAEQNISLLLY